MAITETFKRDIIIKKHLARLFDHDDRFEIHQVDPGMYERDTGRKTIAQYAIYMNDNGILKSWYIYCQSKYIKTTVTLANFPIKRTQLSSLKLIQYNHPSGSDTLAYKHINDDKDVDEFFDAVEYEILTKSGDEDELL